LRPSWGEGGCPPKEEIKGGRRAATATKKGLSSAFERGGPPRTCGSQWLSSPKDALPAGERGGWGGRARRKEAGRPKDRSSTQEEGQREASKNKAGRGGRRHRLKRRGVLRRGRRENLLCVEMADESRPGKKVDGRSTRGGRTSEHLLKKLKEPNGREILPRPSENEHKEGGRCSERNPITKKSQERTKDLANSGRKRVGPRQIRKERQRTLGDKGGEGNASAV